MPSFGRSSLAPGHTLPPNFPTRWTLTHERDRNEIPLHDENRVTSKATPPRVPSQIRSGVSLISHVGDTQVLEKRRYVDRELSGRERERRGEGEREGSPEEKEEMAAESMALPCLRPCNNGRQAGVCSVPQVVTHSVPKRCSPTLPIHDDRVRRGAYSCLAFRNFIYL